MAILPAHAGAAVFKYRGLKMVGVLNRPAGAQGRRFPAVLMLHGFPGAEKNVDIQRALMERGIVSLALHFCGAWGSEGDYSFGGLVDQASAALRFLGKRPFVDPSRLAVFGFSMGGWTALNLAARAPALRACVAVAPVGGPEMLGPDTARFVRKLSRALRVRSVGALAQDFSAAVRRFDPHEAARALRRPLLLVHGSEDALVPAAISKALAREAGGRKRLAIAQGARHDFLDRRPWLTRLVCGWLEEELAR